MTTLEQTDRAESTSSIFTDSERVQLLQAVMIESGCAQFVATLGKIIQGKIEAAVLAERERCSADNCATDAEPPGATTQPKPRRIRLEWRVDSRFCLGPWCDENKMNALQIAATKGNEDHGDGTHWIGYESTAGAVISDTDPQSIGAKHMLQDISRPLAQALAATPGAMLHAREAAGAIAGDGYAKWREFYEQRITEWYTTAELRRECGRLETCEARSPELLLVHAMRALDKAGRYPEIFRGDVTQLYGALPCDGAGAVEAHNAAVDEALIDEQLAQDTAFKRLPDWATQTPGATFAFGWKACADWAGSGQKPIGDQVSDVFDEMVALKRLVDGFVPFDKAQTFADQYDRLRGTWQQLRDSTQERRGME